MFDIGFSELLVVFVVGLIILGPERLPVAAKTAGLWIRKIRRSVQSIQKEINSQLDQEELRNRIDETNRRIMAETPTTQATMSESPEQPVQENPSQPDKIAEPDSTIIAGGASLTDHADTQNTKETNTP